MTGDQLLQLALALLAVAGTILAGAISRGQDHRVRRQDLRVGWAVELRKLASRMRIATLNYNKRVAVGPTELGRQGAAPASAHQAAWNLWAREVAPFEADFFAYLDLVGFIDEDIRRKASSAFTRFEMSAKGSLAQHMLEASEGYVTAIEDIIKRIDKELGLRTAMSAERPRIEDR